MRACICVCEHYTCRRLSRGETSRVLKHRYKRVGLHVAIPFDNIDSPLQLATSDTRLALSARVPTDKAPCCSIDRDGEDQDLGNAEHAKSINASILRISR